MFDFNVLNKVPSVLGKRGCSTTNCLLLVSRIFHNQRRTVNNYKTAVDVIV